ncbi:S-layer homology domain-containing protein [Paenibacillus silviterrae]|uniref:S-layer homology domain-containing protein n=1 Tax=Paenibacillus silviterrae TaxID=3242194 RepID=UPI0025430064|nr:S-layer homology domain-containing protein [Paenibacillus chinjuensis]
MKVMFQPKALMLALAWVLFFSFALKTSAATDISNHWAEETIAQWVKEGMIEGYEDGTFRPDHSISRAEMAALINRKFHLTPTNGTASFPDVSKDEWQYKPISAATAAGYMKGYEDGTIRPGDAVTRQELAVMLAGLLKLDPGDESLKYQDQAVIPAWSRKEVAAVSAKGFMNGYGDGSFAPARKVTRAEAVVTIERSAQAKLEQEPLTYAMAGIYGPEHGTETLQQDVIVNGSGVTLRNMNISGDLLLGEGIGEGDVTLENVTVRGKTTVKGGGAHSIHLVNSSFATVIIEKAGGEVRIVAAGTTVVQLVEVFSAVNIEEEGSTGGGFIKVTLQPSLPAGTVVKLAGDFQEVQIASSGAIIELIQGSVVTLDVADGASNNLINLGTTVIIKELIASEVIKVEGQGTIEKATLGEGAQATTFEKQPSSLGSPATAPPASSESEGDGSGGGGGQQTEPGSQPPSIVVKGLYHSSNQLLTVDSNFSEFMILFRWQGSTELRSENFGIVAGKPEVLTIKQNNQGPAFGSVTVNGEQWSTLTLTRGSAPYPGIASIFLVDKLSKYTAELQVTVHPNPQTAVDAEAVFVVGDKLIAKYPAAGDFSTSSWVVKDIVSQAVYQALYSRQDQDVAVFTIQGGSVSAGSYTAVQAGKATDYPVVLAGTSTVNGSVYGKLFYNGQAQVTTVINATYAELAPALVVDDVIQLYYGNQFMVSAVWDGTAWVYTELVKEPVTAPVSVSAAAMTNRKIQVSWSPVGNASYYHIYSRPAEGGEFTLLKDLQGNDVKATGTTYIDDTLSPNTTRFYLVKAVLGGTGWAIESKPSSTVTATTYYNEHIALDFQVTDSVQHPAEPILYLTDKQNKKLHAINYATGAKSELSLALPPESLTFAGGRIYVSLLKGEHSSYWWKESQEGAVAIVDAASFTVSTTFDISIDPYDIAVDSSGYIYISSGSGQWTWMKSYNPNGAGEAATTDIRQASYIHMHPTLNRVYSITTDSSPRDMRMYHVANGAFAPAGYDSPYHGDYTMDTQMKFSPDGEYIFNGAGTVFRTSTTKYSDMRYMYSLNRGFTDIAFDLDNTRFYTTKDKQIGAYRYSDFDQFGTFHADGTTKALYNSADRILAISSLGSRQVIELVEKSSMETLPATERQGIYLHGSVSDVVYSQATGKAYAVDEAFHKLYVVDLASGQVEQTKSLDYKPSELALSEDGTKLYIRNNDANVLVTEISLATMQVTRDMNYQAAGDSSDQAHGHIYQKGNYLFILTGEFEPKLLMFNAATFAPVNYGAAIGAIGDLAWTSDRSKLYYWYQSGWGAGNAGTDVYEISVSGSTLTQSARSQIGYPNFLRDPLDTPMLVLEEQGVVIAKNRVLRKTNLNETVTLLPEAIYGVSPDRTKLVGKTGIYDAVTYQKLQPLSLSGASHIFYVNDILYYMIGNSLLHL